MNTQTFIKLVKSSHSKSEIARALKIPINSVGLKKVTKLINDLNIDISHFNPYYFQINNTKYKIVDKSCPVCGTNFKTQDGHKREKTTCSSKCANTYFRSGENNPNYKKIGTTPNTSYRRICFTYHKKECVICSENKILDVHHYDGNNKNNNPENLVPLCRTHHSYWHSKYRIEIKDKVDKYIEWFKNNIAS